MELKYIFGIILIVLIIFLLYKKSEHFTSINEAVLNIASIYADVSGTVAFNSLRANMLTIKDFYIENLDVSGNTRLGNKLDVSGNTSLIGQLDVSGTTNLNVLTIGGGADIRNYLVGCVGYDQNSHEWHNSGSSKEFRIGSYNLWGLSTTEFENSFDILVVYPGFIVEAFEGIFDTNRTKVKISNAGIKPLRVNLVTGTIFNKPNNEGGDIYNYDGNTYKIEGSLGGPNNISSLTVSLLDNAKWKAHNPN